MNANAPGAPIMAWFTCGCGDCYRSPFIRRAELVAGPLRPLLSGVGLARLVEPACRALPAGSLIYYCTESSLPLDAVTQLAELVGDA